MTNIDWVIVGGESGRNHRPIEKEWVEDILKQCQDEKVAFFFKQWGGITPKSGGNLLNGRTWQQMPTAWDRHLNTLSLIIPQTSKKLQTMKLTA